MEAARKDLDGKIYDHEDQPDATFNNSSSPYMQCKKTVEKLLDDYNEKTKGLKKRMTDCEAFIRRLF